MLPLILRLSQLDADAAGALRVVSFFDTLIARRVTLEAVVRSTAGLAECPAGLRDDVSGRVLRQGPRGPVSDGPPDRVQEHEIALDDVRVGTVWLERPDPPSPLDAMVLERMALAAAALWPDGGSVALSDPALVELAVSVTTPDADRARALRLLGFPPEGSVRALAVRAADARSAATAIVRCLRPSNASSPPSASSPQRRAPSGEAAPQTGPPGPSGFARAAVISDGEAAIVVADDRGLVPELTPAPGVRVGVGSRVGVAGLARSWQQARTAVRFAGVLGRPWALAHAALGSLATLAVLSPATVDDDPDVRLLRRLAADPAGQRDLGVLEAYLATGSQRHAAAALHRHHSSVSRRLEVLSLTWGLELERPPDRLRAETAYLLYAISRDPA